MNLMWKVIFGLVLTLFVTGPARAAILYVSKDSSCPGTGSTSNPYCSIANAVNAVRAGDTIRIRDASSPYNETIETNKSGTAGSPITVEADAGHNPTILNSGNGSQCATFWIYDANYWTIQNLNFDATGMNGCVWGAIYIKANTRDVSGHQILNNTFKGWGNSTNNAPSAAMVIDGGAYDQENQGHWPNNILIQGNTFDTNRLANIWLTHVGNVGPVTIQNNDFKGTKCGTDTDGAINELGIKAVYVNSFVAVQNNTFHDFDPVSNCTRGSMVNGTYTAYWCDVGGRDATISDNTIWNFDPNKTVDINVFISGLFIEAGCSSHTVSRNVIYNVNTGGIYSSYHSLNSSQRANIYENNTIYNVKGYGFFLKEGVITMKNNIVKNSGQAQVCYGCGSGRPSSISLTSDYNLYDDGGTQAKIAEYSGVGTLNFANWKSRCNCDSHSLNTNPLFVNPPSDLNLQSSSPAPGAGENGIDMGALPYVGAASSVSGAPTAPVNLVVTP